MKSRRWRAQPVGKETSLVIDEKYPETQLLFKAGKDKGYLLYEEIQTVLSDEVTAAPDDLEEVYSRFFELGIEIVTDPDRAARKRAALEAESAEERSSCSTARERSASPSASSRARPRSIRLWPTTRSCSRRS